MLLYNQSNKFQKKLSMLDFCILYIMDNPDIKYIKILFSLIKKQVYTISSFNLFSNLRLIVQLMSDS